MSPERIFVTYFNKRTGDALTKLRYVVAVYSFLITIVFFGGQRQYAYNVF